MKLKSLLSTAAVVVIFTFAGCKKDAPFVPFFSIADDKTLGQQVEAEIASKPSEYPVLDIRIHLRYPQRDPELRKDRLQG
jgi:hypothetical protein